MSRSEPGADLYAAVDSDLDGLQALVETLANKFDMNRVLDEQSLKFERGRERPIRILQRIGGLTATGRGAGR